MEPATPVEGVTATKPSTLEAAAMESWIAMESATPVPSALTMPSTGTKVVPSARVTATVETAAAVEAVEPWTGADEHAPGKVVRAVITVRRACVGRIPVVTVGADRGRPDVGRSSVNWPRPDSNPNSNLSVSSPRARHRHKKSQQDSVF
jgi:hypothetical protein